MGGMILGLIEGVSVAITSISMRRQYQMMEEMQKQEMERIKSQMQRGKMPGSDPFNQDYNETLAKQGAPEKETIIDKAKSFSFWSVNTLYSEA